MEINGPLNLALTIKSGQTSEPEWEETRERFIDVTRLKGTAVKCIIKQVGETRKPGLLVHAVPAKGERLAEQEVVAGLSRLLRLHDDLHRIYGALEGIGDTRLNETIHNFQGLRLMQSRNPYVGLICSIWSQNNSVRLWNRSVRIMTERFGEKAHFDDGSKHRIFPSAHRVAKINVNHFKAVTRSGYRAKYIVQAARLVRDGDLDFEEISHLGYESARKTVMEILGIGPKVADCFLLYSIGKTEAAPVDVWIHRIARQLFFENAKITRERVAKFLRAEYGALAGYAQLYLFCLAREAALKKALSATAA